MLLSSGGGVRLSAVITSGGMTPLTACAAVRHWEFTGFHATALARTV
ncbi:hypothetical protein [Microvirga brassicacearum]|nr:hypothetical protein [Microvirga brassicacearum]